MSNSDAYASPLQLSATSSDYGALQRTSHTMSPPTSHTKRKTKKGEAQAEVKEEEEKLQLPMFSQGPRTLSSTRFSSSLSPHPSATTTTVSTHTTSSVDAVITTSIGQQAALRALGARQDAALEAIATIRGHLAVASVVKTASADNGSEEEKKGAKEEGGEGNANDRLTAMAAFLNAALPLPDDVSWLDHLEKVARGPCPLPPTYPPELAVRGGQKAASALLAQAARLRSPPKATPFAVRAACIALAEHCEAVARRAASRGAEGSSAAQSGRAPQEEAGQRPPAADAPAVLGGVGLRFHRLPQIVASALLELSEGARWARGTIAMVRRPPAEAFPFGALALAALWRRLFETPVASAMPIAVQPPFKPTAFFVLQPEFSRAKGLLSQLRAGGNLPSASILSQLAVITLLGTVDDATGEGMATTPDGTVIFGEGLTLMANAVEYEDEIPLAGIRTSLLCSQRILQQQFCPSVRQRITAVAPANLLLRWLADIRSLREEADRLYELQLAPDDVETETQAIRPGSLIRMHRAMLLMRTLLYDDGVATIGDFMQMALPLLTAHYQSLRDSVGSDPSEIYAALRRNPVATLLPASDNMSEQPLGLLRTISPLEQQVAPLSSSQQAFDTSVAAGELLFALCLDEPGAPLRRYSDELILDLVEHMADGFPELDNRSLPSYWKDPNLLHAVLRASTAARCSSPHAVWLFRDFVNSLSREGSTPLLQVIENVSDNLPLAQQQIAYLIRLGADVDGPNRRGITPVDICAEKHPELFMQLIGAGSHGGARTVMLLKLYKRLQRMTFPEDAPRLAALRALVDRNRQLNWAVALDRVLPSVPEPSETMASFSIVGETVLQRPMPAWAYDQLFSKAIGGDAADAELSRGRRRVSCVVNPDFWLAFKFRPELPGLQSAVGEFSRRLFGDWIAPYTEFLRVETPTEGVIPALMSLGVSGVPLQRVLEADPGRLELLEASSISMALINAMLTCVEDGHPDQYVVEPLENGLYRIVCIDAERGFCPTERPPGSSRTLWRRQPSLPQPKSVLFCLDQMRWAVEPSVRTRLLGLDPAYFILRWLAKAILINTQHRALFTSEEAQALLSGDQPTVLGVPVDAGRLARTLYNRIRRLQAALTRSASVTHLDLFYVLEPEIAARYSPFLSGPEAARHPVLERFQSVDGAHFKTRLPATSDALVTPAPGTAAECKEQPPLETVVTLEHFLGALGLQGLDAVSSLVLSGADHCPEKAREIATGLQTQCISADGIGQRQTALQTNARTLTDLQAEAEQERLLTGMDWGLVEAPVQMAVLRHLQGRNLRLLTLHSMSVLTDTDIFSRMPLEGLTDISLVNNDQLKLGCKAATALATGAPFLRRLTLAVLPAATGFEARVSGKASSFPRLRRFAMTNCTEVTKIAFRAPLLVYLDVSHCSKLEMLAVDTPQLDHVLFEGCPLKVAVTNSAEDTMKLSKLAPPTDYRTVSSRATITANLNKGLRSLQATFRRRRNTSEPLLPEAAVVAAAADDTQRRLEARRGQVSRTLFWISHVLEIDATLDAMSAAQRKQIVKTAKGGIPPNVRGAVWLRLTGGFLLLQQEPELYEQALRQRFGQTLPSQLGAIEPPNFGVVFNPRRLGLSDDMLLAYARVLCCLAQSHSDTLYCPWIPMVVACCILVMSEEQAFATASALLLKAPHLIRQRQETWLMVCTFEELAEQINDAARVALFRHVGLESDKATPMTAHPMQGVVIDWVCNCLPRDSLFHFMDNWLIKGRKMFYRYGLAILSRWHEAFRQSEAKGAAKRPSQADAAKQREGGTLLPRDVALVATDAATLAVEAFAFSFTSKEIDRCRQAAHERAWTSLTVSGFFLGVNETWTDAMSVSTSLDVPPSEGHAWMADASSTEEAAGNRYSVMSRESFDGDANNDRALGAAAPGWHWGDAMGKIFRHAPQGRSLFGALTMEAMVSLSELGRERWSMSSAAAEASEDVEGVQPKRASRLQDLQRHTSAASGVSAFSEEALLAPNDVPRVRAAMRGMVMSSYPEFFKQDADPLESQDLAIVYECARQRVLFQEQLGRGAFGTVCRGLLLPEGMPVEQGLVSMTCDLPPAKHGPRVVLRELAQPVKVAIKTVVPGAGPDEQAKFLLEGRMMMGLQHPNLLRLLAVCTASLPFMLVVEYMPKGDLRDYLRLCRTESGPEAVTEASVTSVGVQIANAMTFLAKRKIVHRDLAARNVLVGSGGLADVKLADFGMSRALTSTDYYRRGANDRIPVKWSAPESTQDRIYTSASDVWSFGVLLWEVASLGRKPYGEFSNIEAFHAIISGYRLPRLTLCTDITYEVMQRCWQAEPADRPTFPELLQTLWDGCAPDPTGKAAPLDVDRLDEAGYILDETLPRQEKRAVSAPVDVATEAPKAPKRKRLAHRQRANTMEKAERVAVPWEASAAEGDAF